MSIFTKRYKEGARISNWYGFVRHDYLTHETITAPLVLNIIFQIAYILHIKLSRGLYCTIVNIDTGKTK